MAGGRVAIQETASCPAIRHTISNLELSLSTLSFDNSGSQFPLSSFKALEGYIQFSHAWMSGLKGNEEMRNTKNI